jgi:hypothetical protein
MGWFRNTIKQGTWLALIALAMNFGLSFGHFHAIDGKAAGRGIVAAVSVAAPGDGQSQNTDDSRADDLCSICMAATAMANALASTPAALPLEFATVSLDRTVEPVLILVEPLRAAFQPRGPPIS